MAVCKFCDQEMADGASCALEQYEFADGKQGKRLRFGQEHCDWGYSDGLRCDCCNCEPDAFHHPGCDIEECARCGEQAFSCDCDFGEELAEIAPLTLVDWHPIEQFFCSADAPELSAFMYMYRVDDPMYGAIHHYKHVDTRNYLMLDDATQAFRWNAFAGFRKISRKKALSIAYEGVDAGLYLSTPGSVPRREIFKCDRNDPASESEAS